METRPGSRHTGIIVDIPHLGGKKFLHLAWQYSFLKDEVPESCSQYSNSSFDKAEQEYLAERLVRRWEKNGSRVAYGIDFDGSSAFGVDELFDGEGGRGLTCATFVLDFLASCGFAVCDVESWSFRSDDRAFQQFIYDQLAMRFNNPEHLEQLRRVQTSVGNAARFRPEEVVACFTRYADDPIRMPSAQYWGYEVLLESGMHII